MPKPTGGPALGAGSIYDPQAGQHVAPQDAQAEQQRKAELMRSQRAMHGQQVQHGATFNPFAGNTYQVQSGGRATYDPSYSDPVKQRQFDVGRKQESFAEEMQKRMRGEGPSVAQEQLRASQEDAVRAAMAQAASARGTSAAQAQRIGAMGQAAAMQGAGRDAAMLRAQEIQQATAGYGQALQQQRAQELMAQGMAQDEAYKIAGLEESYYGRVLGASRGQAGIESENAAGRQQMMQGAMMAAAGAMMLSDVRAKDGVRPDLGAALGQSNRESLEPVNPIRFSYNPQAAAAIGETTDDHSGVAAQDLAKSPAYSGAVM